MAEVTRRRVSSRKRCRFLALVIPRQIPIRITSRVLSVANDRYQKVPSVDAIQSAGPDQRSQDVPDRRPVLGFEEQRVLSHQDELLERPLAFVIIEWRARLPEPQGQLTPMAQPILQRL